MSIEDRLNEIDSVHIYKDKVIMVGLGDGETIISDCYCPDEGLSGISLARVRPGGYGEVGLDLNDNEEAREDMNNNKFIQILTDNPDSLQVLIDKLQLAKEYLVDNQ